MGARLRSSKRLAPVAVAIILLALGLLAPGALADDPPGGPPTPTVSTDKSTYLPGDTVSISGGNWIVGETVHLHVADEGGHGWSRDLDVLVGADGSISDSFALPSEFAAGFGVSATGALGQMATASFSDEFAAPGAPPTIVSDQADYAPGSTVSLSGANWHPGESVHIFVNDAIGQTWSRNVDVNAALDGTIRDSFSLPNYFVSDYTAKATGTSGTATTTFTDKVGTTTTITQTAGTNPSPFGSSVTFRGSVTSDTPGSGTPTGTIDFKDGGTIVCNNVAVSGSGDSASANCTTSTLSVGSHSIRADYNASGSTFNNSHSSDLSFTVTSAASTSLAVSSATDTYGGTVNLSATLMSGGSGVSGKSISFTLNGNSAGSATTNASGVASLSGVSLNGINAGTYATGLQGSFAGDSSYSASSGSNSLTVNKASQTITFTSTAPSSAVYGSTYTPTATGGGSGNPVTFGASGACSYDGNTGKVTMTSTGTCTVTADQPGNGNYNAAPQASQSFSVGKANQATLTVTAPNSGAYGDHLTMSASGGSGTGALSFSATGDSDACSILTTGPDTGKLSIDKGTGTCKITAHKAADSNYSAADSSDHTVTVNPRDATASITAADKTYDGTTATTASCALNPQSGTVGKISGDDVDCTASSADFDTAAAGTGKTVTADVDLTGADEANYQLTASTASTTADINKRNVTATISAADKTYDGSDAATISGCSLEAQSGNHGVLTGETVGCSGSSGHFSSAAAGTGKTVTADVDLTGADEANYQLTASTASTTADINPKPLTVKADNKTMVLNGTVPPLTYTITGFVPGETVALVSGVASCSTANGTAVGIFPITCTVGSLAAPNYSFPSANLTNGTLTVQYAGSASCLGSSGHTILQPVNVDGTSVFKQGSTVPAKFRVCDANGNSIGTPGVVSGFKLIKTVAGTVVQTVDEEVFSTTPDTAFRWSSTDQQWIFNISTKPLKANTTYTYRITLNDASNIEFLFGLK